MTLLQPGWGLRKFIPPVVSRRLYHLEAATYWRQLPLVRRNRELRGRYVGDRCFVLGNGGSLRKMDLAPLASEKVITVNRFVTNFQRYFPFISSFAHAMIDPSLFDGRVDGYETLKAIGSWPNPETMFFLPAAYSNVIRQHVPETAKVDVRYVLYSGRFSAPGPDTTHPMHPIDLAYIVPGSETVACVALLVAIYLGFSDIYLVGCDIDYLSNVVDVNPLRARVAHFYDEGHDIYDYPFDYGDFCLSTWRSFDSFKFLQSKLAPGQRIWNAGVGGMLDVFPRAEFGSLFR
jgi:hypothetical protein